MNLFMDPRQRPHTGHPSSKTKPASIVVWDPSPFSLLALAGVMDSRGYRCVCARTAESTIQALDMGPQDLIVCDVAQDAAAALDTLDQIRRLDSYRQLPAILIAESKWAGLEKKAEANPIATRCLFKPIDPNSLLAVVDQVLWMPALVTSHRRRGSRPSRPGWITL